MKNALGIVAALSVAVTASAASAQQVVYALTASNALRTFSPATPGNLSAPIAISGLPGSVGILAIDFRAVDFELYGIGSDSVVYQINKVTGAATASGPAFSPALSGARPGIDFNPTVDRIRYVDAAAGNRRFVPTTGAVAGNDTNLSYSGGGSPRAVGVAYTNSKLGGVPVGSVREYIIDSANDSLGEVGSQAGGNASFNGGVTTIVGGLGVDTTDQVGFDIYSGTTDIAYASLTSPVTNFSSFYTINLATGAATLVGAIGSEQSILDISVLPEPGSLGLLGGIMAMALIRRR